MPKNPTSSDRFAVFRESVTSDLYDVSAYIDWNGIEDRLALYAGAINYLHGSIDNGSLDETGLASGLRGEPYLYQVASALLAIPRGVGFHDGRELPDPAQRPLEQFEVIAELLIEVGLLRLLEPGVDVQSLARVALTAQDALKRRYRVGSTIKERVQELLSQAIRVLTNEFDLDIQELSEPQWPPAVRERVEYILQLDGRPYVAIASVFQTASGGRQQKDLSANLPNLQRQLSEYGISLLVIADGRGLKQAQESVLEALFSGVASCMTFREAAQGKLIAELRRLASSQPSQSRSISRIILSTLHSRGYIDAKDLPLDTDRSRIALATFIEEHSDLDLILADEGSLLFWRRKDLVDQARSLSSSFAIESAVNCFAQLLGASISEPIRTVNSLGYSIQLITENLGVLPNKLLVGASMNAADPALFREIAGLALTNTPDSKFAVLLSPQSPGIATAASLRTLQRVLTSNVVVIDSNLLLNMAERAQLPRDAIAHEVLTQSDLVKASPFVVNSVTPERMFFGREAEEATMISTLTANSVALLGGRRIGKTSLMRHAEKRLRDAGFATYFADCQTVRDWADFAAMARRTWRVNVDTPFTPSKLFDLVQKLIDPRSSKTVFLLDEIDHLLEWDTVHPDDEVTEAFFRACRTISQEQVAQFVFSGERTIARRLWDPHSPHWNFSHPIMLRWLDPEAARKLILNPLKAMQIEVDDEEGFASIAWSRTNGHPRLLQLLGDRLIRQINEREPASRTTVEPSDLTNVSDTYSYAEQYLETYWGQATVFERLITLIVATGNEELGQQKQFLDLKGVPFTDGEIRGALRILELYGIIGPTASGYKLLLDWLLDAIEFYGGIDDLLGLYLKDCHE